MRAYVLKHYSGPDGAPLMDVAGPQPGRRDILVDVRVRHGPSAAYQANVSLADDMLIARFSVSAPPLNAKKVLGPNEHPYQFDVVELFVTFSDSGFPYYEFEVSPYNQTFQVRIVSVKQHQEGVDLSLKSAATISPAGWTAELKILLKLLGWDGKPENIRGNLYAVLGPAKKRSYWSAFLPQATKANFHQPEYFMPLLQCSASTPEREPALLRQHRTTADACMRGWRM